MPRRAHATRMCTSSPRCLSGPKCRCSIAAEPPATWAGSGATAGAVGPATRADSRRFCRTCLIGAVAHNDPRRAVACGAAAALLGIGTTIGGLGSSAAQPNDYGTLPVDPSLVTDSLAYNAAPPVFDPSGQPGVTAVYTHRGGERQITNTIL